MLPSKFLKIALTSPFDVVTACGLMSLCTVLISKLGPTVFRTAFLGFVIKLFETWKMLKRHRAAKTFILFSDLVS